MARLRWNLDYVDSWNAGRDLLCLASFSGVSTAAPHQNVGRELLHEFLGTRTIGELYHGFNRLKGRDNFSPFSGRCDGTARAFLLARLCIALNRNHQNIAQRSRLFEQTDVPGMQQIKDPRDAHNALSIAFPVAPLENQLALRDHRQDRAPLRKIEKNRKHLILPRPPQWPRTQRPEPQNENL